MKVAIYPGSFNPFHKGHHNILLKAEKIFDKVIIARGVNLEKNNELVPLPKILGNREVLTFNTLLPDFIKTLPYDNVTVIRGLRNHNDFDYEMAQYRYFQDMMPEFQMISIFCDREYDYLASSGVRIISKFDTARVKDYLID